MNQTASSETSPSEFRTAVRAYAERICHVLGKSMNVISQVAQQQQPRETYYQNQTLLQLTPQSEREGENENFASGKRRGNEAERTPLPPILEQRLLQEWRAEGYRQPLLIVAPAGSGKSCLLESFTLQMARDLLKEESWEGDQLLTGTPVLISLFKMGRTPLLEYLSLAETELTKKPPVLSSALLEELQQQRKLVLLIDGYDEVPPDRHDLGKILPIWEGRFVLTSRSGYGERNLVRNRERQKTLQVLKKDPALKYVERYFEECGYPETSQEEIKKKFLQAWDSRQGRLLRRPLYLKAWCDFVEEGHGKKPPESLGQLAKLMLRKTLEGRKWWKKLFHTMSPDERYKIVQEFIDWFGRLALYFTEQDFRDQTTEVLVSQGLLGENVKQFKLGKHERSFKDLAKECGLLRHAEYGDTYSIPKIPLVEYAIGKYLADDVHRNPLSPELLTETFRRWIWRPWRHDILDYTFDALWHDSESRVVYWGNELLAWAKRVGQQDATRSHQTAEPPQDDLIHPFPCAVLRWRMLNSRGRTENLNEDLNEFVRSTLPALRNGMSFTDLVADHRIYEEFATPLMKYLIAEYCLDEGDSAAQEAWRWAIEAAAGRVSESSAAGVVSQLIEHHRLAAGNPNAQVDWRGAIQNAAGRVSESSASGVVSQWIEQYRLAAGNPNAKEAWRDAIRSAAGRVSESSASEVVLQLIEQHRLAAGNPVAQEAWRWAIGHAASRVSESSAAEVVSRWVEQHQLTEGDPDAKKAWGWAIWGAAGRVSVSSVDEIVTQWIKQHRLAAGDPAAQEAWRVAIQSAEGWLSETSATGVVSFWIEQHQLAERDPGAQWAWLEAIKSAVRRVSESSAVGIVSEWLTEYRLAEGDPDAKKAWQWAIWGASNWVSESCAAEVVLQWIEQHRLAAGDSATQEVWRGVIRNTARQVSESSAAGVVSQWIEQLRLAAGDPNAQEAWRDAIWSVAGRVSESSADEIVTQLIVQHRLAAGDSAAQEDWRGAIRNAAGRVREDGTSAERESSVVRVCELLIENGMQDLAFRVAANNPSIAMVSIRTESPSAEGNPDVTFQALLRRNQILDEKLLVAPPAIRCVYIESAFRILEKTGSHSQDIKPLQGIPTDRNETIAFIRRNIERLPVDRETKEVRHEFQAKLQRIEEGDLLPLNSLESESIELFKSLDGIAKRDVNRKTKANLPRPIINLAGVRSGPFKLLCFYEIGFEYQHNRCRSLSQIALAFKEMAAKEVRSDGMPSRTLDPGISSYTTAIRRYCNYAMEIFGKHFLADDRFKGEIGELGLAPLFLSGEGSEYENLSELGLEAWRLCRQDLIRYRLIKEND